MVVNQSIFALVDCNNFYASCERIFNPSLEKKPIVILSNNDGCIIARSNEAKKLGVPMGEPFYKARKICQHNDVSVFSSNYQLYGDISQRVMNSLSYFTPDIEIYSIDEAFLRLDNLAFLDKNFLDDISSSSLETYAHHIKDKIQQWLGIPVSIGLGPTKTIAKIANSVAKEKNTGVYNLMNPLKRDFILKQLMVDDIWGIGKRWATKLYHLGISTAYQLKETDTKFIRKYFSVVGERIVYELKGISCLEIEKIIQKKNIMTSRSFGYKVTDYTELSEALSCYTARAGEKLRSQSSYAQGVYVFLKTNKYDSQTPYYRPTSFHSFQAPTNDTAELIKAAKSCLKKIYKPHFRYIKTGIMLTDIVPSDHFQKNLFDEPPSLDKQFLLETLDHINYRYHKEMVFYGAQGIQRKWKNRCDKISARYTTKWDELPLIY